MAKYTLESEFDFDFDLIGISCQEKSHKMAWLINLKLNFNLIRIENHIIKLKNINQEHSIFEYIDFKTEESFYLLKNKSELGFLAKEQKGLDYFLLIKNTNHNKTVEIIKKTRMINTVLLVTELNILELKSKENFIL